MSQPGSLQCLEELKLTKSLLEATLSQLMETTTSSLPAQIERLDGTPDSATLSHYKDLNFPVIFTNAVPHWPAHRLWNKSYFAEVMGEDLVTVAMTPDGLADSIKDNLFITPHEARAPMSEMLQWLDDPIGDVKYLQLQNGSLNLEFQKLGDDVDRHGPAFARGVFTPHHHHHDHDDEEEFPLANVWIGNHRSVTSLHHDPYENIYVQIRGFKKFTLFPPSTHHFLHERRYACGKYVPDCSGALQIERAGDDHMVPWLRMPSPHEPITQKAMHVLLAPGETLYLPALWFHHVQQVDDEQGLCCAVNYWYNLDYDADLWRNWKFNRKVSLLAHGKIEECRRELQEEEDL